MSLCYDFQKWTIISLSSVAISLTIGLLLINFAHADKGEELKKIKDYCFAHASDIIAGGNPVNDLVSSGLISSEYSGKNCTDIDRDLFAIESLQEKLDNLKSGFDNCLQIGVPHDSCTDAYNEAISRLNATEGGVLKIK